MDKHEENIQIEDERVENLQVKDEQVESMQTKDEQVESVQTEDELNKEIQRRINERMGKCNVEILTILKKYSAELKGFPKYVQMEDGTFSLVINVAIVSK